MKPAYTIIPTISEDGYLYIISGPNNLESNLSQRYIITYDINSAKFINKYNYNTSFAFVYGEAYAFLDKSQYLFINSNSRTNDIGSFGVRDIRSGEEKIWEDSSICGIRRSFKKAGYFYYFAHLDCNNGENNYLFIKKMVIDYYKDNIPHFEIIKTNNELKVLINSDISCDLTKDNNYIICAYYTDNDTVNISVFNNELKLLLTETLGEVKSKNYYATIIYFKENSNFIMMNSQTSLITRLSYFSYSNNQFIDKLSSITEDSQHYLDIENTQYNGYINNNYITTVDDKIIKIFTRRGSAGGQIIITIIQFYENDTSMSIKIYNMFNNNGFSSFFYPRISILKQSFVFCSSSVNDDDIRRTGYFFINYPNSTDINLDKNNIIIKDLINLENKLFSINLKFKVLSIPDDFKLISKSNSLEINNNDELELSDELILRQYKINEGPYILKYQAIARGTDLGYSHLNVYPPHKVLVNKELLFEGRHGKITIDFKKCLDGYYNFENSENLCSNVRPKGYYLDKENKIFRACPLTCEDCDAPDTNHTNCLSCKVNYYMTEDTEACCEKGEDNYYFDENTNKLRRCHQNCLKCYGSPIDETNMNCYKCPDNFYMTENTKCCYDYIPNHYYLDDKILRHCYKRCNNCLGTKNNDTMNCLECISDEYFFKNDTNDCILPNEFKKRDDLEFKKVNNSNLFIFIMIFISALIIFIITCKFYKIKETDKQEQNKEQQKQQKKGLLNKKNDEKIYEMENKYDFNIENNIDDN